MKRGQMTAGTWAAFAVLAVIGLAAYYRGWVCCESCCRPAVYSADNGRRACREHAEASGWWKNEIESQRNPAAPSVSP